MTSELGQIAYNEGFLSFEENILSIIDNPYVGVNVLLANHWDQGYWDAWYYDIDEEPKKDTICFQKTIRRPKLEN